MSLYTADFETLNELQDCRVWAVGICDIDSYRFMYGNTIEWFINFLENHGGDTFYFHNLKFDGEFIISFLFNHGFTHVTDKRNLAPFTFATLISDMGQFYSMDIMFESGKITIYDSLKILPFSVENVAKGFGLPISKLSIDYNAYREYGHILTPTEVDYLRCDVEIMARALHELFDQKLNKMTQGSNALHNFKTMMNRKVFEKTFPIPNYNIDQYIRQSYKGGFVYVKPEYQGLDLGPGLVFDVNSLYPWAMRYNPMPYGEPVQFQGGYVHDPFFPLYVQTLKCQFELKQGHIPCICEKSSRFKVNEYLTNSGDEEMCLCLTSVDLQLFFEHYDAYNIEYLDGFKFKAKMGIFDDYIDHWFKVKTESKREGNKTMQTLAKLMLNALYGKFALNPNVRSKYPFLDSDGTVRYQYGPKEMRDPIYIPVGTFITSYAREKTIRSAQKVFDRFVYADTDSLHLIGTDIPKEIEIDDYTLGAWKLESQFTRARFLRTKAYCEEINGELEITCSGMPDRCKTPSPEKSLSEEMKDLSIYDSVTWENFKIGNSFVGKLAPKHVPGGIVLQDTLFSLRHK